MQDTRQTCEALRTCFNTLNAVIKDSTKDVRSSEYADTFVLSAAARLIYNRWEQETQKLRPSPPPSTDFHSPAPLPVPSVPDYLASLSRSPQ